MKYASEKQMSYLRMLFYKSPLLTFESYDTFDDINRELVSHDDAQTLINRKQNDPDLKNEVFRQEVIEIIRKVESQL